MSRAGSKAGRSRRRYRGINKTALPKIPTDDESESDEPESSYSVEKVIGHRINDEGVKEYEIKWKDFPSDQNTCSPSKIYQNDDVWIGLLDDIDQNTNTMNHQKIHKNMHSRRIKTYGRSANTNRRCGFKPIVSTEDALKSDYVEEKKETQKRSESVDSVQSVSESPQIMTKRQKRKSVVNIADDDEDDDLYRPSVSLDKIDDEEEEEEIKESVKRAKSEDDESEDDADNDEDQEADEEPTYEVEAIRKHRKSLKKGYPKTKENGERCLEYCVKWKGWGEETNTWEHESVLTNCNKVTDAYWKEVEEKKAKKKKQNVRKVRKKQKKVEEKPKETENKPKRKQKRNFKVNRTLPLINDEEDEDESKDTEHQIESEDKENEQNESNVDKTEEEKMEENENSNEIETENKTEKKSRKRALSEADDECDVRMGIDDHEPPRKRRRVDRTRERIEKGGLEMFMKILDNDNDNELQEELMTLVEKING